MTPVRDLLEEIRRSPDPRAALDRHAYHGPEESEKELLRRQGYEVYQGKVRELARKDGELLIYHTDRLTAFDKYIDMIPYKGTILAGITRFWMAEAEKIMPTHYLGAPHERLLKVRAMNPYKVEVIVRGYMAGSMMRAYDKGERLFCGAALPDGLKSWGKLPENIITPTTKAAAFEHDEDATPDELIEQGVCTRAEWEEISSKALELFARGQEVYQEKGWILVDTKYEFGKDDKGQIFVIDEAHTPDSSRLWTAATMESRLSAGQAPDMLDKEIVRRWLMENGFKGEGKPPEVPVETLIALAETYLDVAERLMGEPLLSSGPVSGSLT